MTTRGAIVLIVGLVVAAVATRLGFWQLERLHEKRAANAGLRSALALPPAEWSRSPDSLARLLGRRVVVRGTYDESRHVLLAGRSHGAAPGVRVATPLRLDDGTVVIVDRGWMPSVDAATARPQDVPEPGPREVIGLLEPIPVGVAGPPWVPLPGEGPAIWSVRRLDLDSLRDRIPGPLATVLVRQLPARGLPALPLREPPGVPGEGTHLGYALQWFAIAFIALAGGIALARPSRPDGGKGVAGEPPPDPPGRR